MSEQCVHCDRLCAQTIKEIHTMENKLHHS
jgi:hypothetical protein